MRADRRGARQRGAALLVVMVLAVVSAFAVMGVARLMLLNESELGTAADQARAFAAASALLRDAETDVTGSWPDGSRCGPPDADAGCRKRDGGIFLPLTSADRDLLADALAAEPGLPCRQGVCLPADPAVSLIDNDLLDASNQPPGVPRRHAFYGEFTGAVPGQSAALSTDAQDAASRGRYWVEVLDYATASAIADIGSPYDADPTRPFAFRITAAARGRRADIQVVLREIFVPSPLRSTP